MTRRTKTIIQRVIGIVLIPSYIMIGSHLVWKMWGLPEALFVVVVIMYSLLTALLYIILQYMWPWISAQDMDKEGKRSDM